MKLLALDTSSNACSVALQVSDDVRVKHVVEPRAHTKILMPMISELLAESGISISDLDAVVVGNGPGSFIGMRIGASVAQGLSFAAGIGVVPVSSLAAVAAEAMTETETERVVVVQDARMHEVYLGCFDKGENGLPVAIGDERIVAVGELPVSGVGYAVAGAGWDRYPELLRANNRWIGRRMPIDVPHARYLLCLGATAASGGKSIAPEALIPAYLRTQVAEKPRVRH